MKHKVEAVSTAMRATFAGLMLGAILIGPGALQAFAQPPSGASETITVTEEDKNKPAAAEAAPAAKTAPVTNARSAVTDRDPFVNPLGLSSGSSRPKVRKTNVVTPPAAKAAAGDAAGAAAPAAKKAEEPAVEAPAVSVTGILASGSGNRAILTAPNQSYIVKVGDKLGDYRVAAITDKAVTFKFKDKSFKVPMESDMGTASK